MWLATGVLWVLALILVLTNSPKGTSDIVLVLVVGLPMATYASVGALVARTSPPNPIGWLLSAVGFALALWMFALAYAQVGIEAGTMGDLGGADSLAWVGVLALLAVLPITLPIFLLYFPDGHLRSRGWRPVLWVAVLGGFLMVVGALGIAWDMDPVVLRPPTWAEGIGALEVAYGVGALLIVATSFAGLFALILRFREAAPQQRHALRLLVGVLVAMAVATAVVLVLNVIPGTADATWAWIFFLLAIVVDAFGVLFGIPLAAAAAVLTFGLYDVGVVVKKTVVYVLLVVLFLLLLGLVSLIVNPVALTGAGSSEDTASRIVTAGAVILAILAIGFRPVKRLARRIVYGRRSTPYEAMSEFSERLGEAYATDDVLPRMASIVRTSTGAEVARVWLHVGREFRPVASAPPDAAEPRSAPIAGDEPPDLEGSRVFPVRDRGDLLGALTVEMPAAEPLSKTGEQLVTDLAGQAGLVLRNVRLVEELQESRRRIVTAQDERARKLERDLHDGAQQQLVALSVKLGLAEQLLSRDPDRAAPLLAELKVETTDALDTLRDLARGIYPPVLADQGLGAALEAQARKSPIPVSFDPDGVGRYPQEVEAAVYFCALEALNNVAKYARASSVEVRLSQRDDILVFEVRDDGVGFDVAGSSHGTGLQGMADRLEAVGGELELMSAPGHGTTIGGRVPVGPDR